MSLISKIALGLGAVSLVILVVARFLLGQWIVFLWAPLGLFLLGLLISLVLDFKAYWSFFTLKTTRQGMNFGLSIIIALVIFSSLGFLSVLWDKTFDLTEGKIFSLSEQTVKVLESMKESDIRVLIFYKGKDGKKEKEFVKESLLIFKQAVKNLKVEYIDAHVSNLKSKEYLESLSDKSSQNIFVFVEYLSKRARVSAPFMEGEFLSALIKAGRKAVQKVYFTSGHGERDLFSEKPEGAKSFRLALEESSFTVEEWNFIEQQKGLPDSAQALVILGPVRPFFEKEIEWLKEFIQKKGRIFLALDPGTDQNLTSFVEENLGVTFKNNFIVSPISRIFGESMTSILGMRYHSEALPTKAIAGGRQQDMRTLFREASEVAANNMVAEKGWTSYELVYSDPSAFTLLSLKDPENKQREQKSRVLGMAVQEKPPQKKPSHTDVPQKEEDAGAKQKGFYGVVFGDSDFVTNQSLSVGVNRDLALNIISYLGDQVDLTHIRPKQPKGTRVTLTSASKNIYIVFAILLPVLLFVLAGVSWFFRARA